MILVGDIGGTKVRLALVAGRGKIELKEEEFFFSAQFASFDELLQEYLKKRRGKISRICLGVAGPVLNGQVKATNLPWVVDAKNIQKIGNVEKVDLLNDLEANAYGISVLEEKDFFVLQKGVVRAGANAALISAGTGLGEAGLFWNGKTLIPFASEGGHSDFSPSDEREWELFCELKKHYGHVSYERILSGPGLVFLLSFLQKKQEKKTTASQGHWKERGSSVFILEKALKKEDLLCEEALLWFSSLYGREAGNLALKFLALQGVYIGGGMAPLLPDFLKKSSFVSSFADKGRFSDLLRHIPIKVILNERAPLLGAAIYSRKNI